MEEKKKFLIIIGATAVLAIVFFSLNLHTQSLKKATERERDEVTAVNAALTKQVEEVKKKLDEAVKEKDRLSGEMGDLNNKMAEVVKEKDNFKSQYEGLVKEMEQLKSKPKPSEAAVATEEQNPPVSADAYWSGVLKAKADLEMKLEKARNDLKMAQINSDQLKKEKEALDLDLKNIDREKQGTEEQLGYNQKMIDSMTTELVIEKNVKIKSQNDLRVVKNENAALRRQLKALSNYKFRLEEKLQKLQGEKSILERRFNEMSALLENRVSALGGMKEELDAIRGVSPEKEEAASQRKESVELPPIMVHPADKGSAPETNNFSLSDIAKIISLDRDNNFAIIDLGEDSGISVGKVFRVYRHGRPIADIEVMQVRKNISACDIKKENTPIKVGDTVK